MRSWVWFCSHLLHKKKKKRKRKRETTYMDMHVVLFPKLTLGWFQFLSIFISDYFYKFGNKRINGNLQIHLNFVSLSYGVPYFSLYIVISNTLNGHQAHCIGSPKNGKQKQKEKWKTKISPKQGKQKQKEKRWAKNSKT